MATITPLADSPSPRADPDPVESSNPLFDDPEADVILHSCDSQIFRVLKIYIIRSSTVLGDLIRAAPDLSGTANASSSEERAERLPEVQLSDSSAILSSLLTFIFPVPPVLPSTLEETMELLSAAQKYEMVSVLTHIRSFLSVQDPPFIHSENAFRVYSLAQRFGLRKEATQAARLTLKFTLTIESLEDKLKGVPVPGPYLHELWKYHQRVRAQLLSDLSWPGAAVTLNTANALIGFGCTRRTWVQTYVQSIITNPSLFDPIEFHMALAWHVQVRDLDMNCYSAISFDACSSCANNSVVDNMRIFWTALAAAVNHCIEKAEPELSILGTEMNSQRDTGSLANPLPLPECLDTGKADIIVRSSDLTNFLVHKSVLASSSSVFRDMFSLPNLSNDGMIDELPVVDISEDAELVRSLITMLYPIPPEIPASYDRILALLSAAQKYEMDAVQSSIRAEVARGPSLALEGVQAYRAYVIANSSGLRPEMDMAARLTLDQPMTFEHLGDELRLFEGRVLRELASFREQCRDNLTLCFRSFLLIVSGPSKIWVGCPGNKTEQTEQLRRKGNKKRVADHAGNEAKPTLPLWLHDMLFHEIGELKHAFARPLIKPSSIRNKYLEALQSHVTPDLCTFCVRVHVISGEWYCVQLEKELALAREKALVISA